MTVYDELFIKFVKKELKRNGIDCILTKGKTVKCEGALVGGYFSDSEKKLVCATGRCFNDWFAVFVHEYSHYTQWKDNCKPWSDVGNSLDIMWNWLNNKDYPNINKHIDKCKNLELDNEKRSVQLIKDFNLSLNIPIYIKKANAYIYFYNYMKITRRWVKKGKSVYNNNNILKYMPDTFRASYKRLPKKIEKVFVQEEI